jgi:CheY-like chemotaxis protein
MMTKPTAPLVLIADDNRDMRDMYALYLSMTGYAVETAAEGREAVVKALTLRPDLIVTGHDFKNYLKPAAVALGACSFLMKPCLPEDLAREISEYIPTRQNRATTAS